MPFLSGGKLGCDRPPSVLASFLASLPQRVVATARKGTAADTDTHEPKATGRKHDYTEEKDCPKEPEAVVKEAMQPDTDDDEDTDSDWEDEALDCLPAKVAVDMWEDLAAMRRDFAAEVAGSGDDFILEVRGGRGAFKKGKAGDVIVYYPKKGGPKDFAKKYSLPAYKSWTIEHLTYPGCVAMAFETARRMQHYYDVFLVSAEAMHEFTPEEITSYEWSPQWLAFKDRLPANGPLYRRAREVEDMTPGKPIVPT